MACAGMRREAPGRQSPQVLPWEPGQWVAPEGPAAVAMGRGADREQLGSEAETGWEDGAAE